MSNENLNRQENSQQEKQEKNTLGAAVVWGIIALVVIFIVYQVGFKKDNTAVLNSVAKDVFIVKTELFTPLCKLHIAGVILGNDSFCRSVTT